MDFIIVNGKTGKKNFCAPKPVIAIINSYRWYFAVLMTRYWLFYLASDLAKSYFELKVNSAPVICFSFLSSWVEFWPQFLVNVTCNSLFLLYDLVIVTVLLWLGSYFQECSWLCWGRLLKECPGRYTSLLTINIKTNVYNLIKS